MAQAALWQKYMYQSQRCNAERYQVVTTFMTSQCHLCVRLTNQSGEECADADPADDADARQQLYAQWRAVAAVEDAFLAVIQPSNGVLVHEQTHCY